jgi:hypothetical protein
LVYKYKIKYKKWNLGKTMSKTFARDATGLVREIGWFTAMTED